MSEFLPTFISIFSLMAGIALAISFFRYMSRQLLSNLNQQQKQAVRSKLLQMLPALQTLYRLLDFFSDPVTFAWKKSGDILMVGLSIPLSFMLVIYSLGGNTELLPISGALLLVSVCGLFRLFDDMEWFITGLLFTSVTTTHTFSIVLFIPPSNTRDGMLVAEFIAVVLMTFAVAGFFGLLSKGMSAAEKRWFKKVDDDPLSSVLDDLDKQAQPQP